MLISSCRDGSERRNDPIRPGTDPKLSDQQGIDEVKNGRFIIWGGRREGGGGGGEGKGEGIPAFVVVGGALFEEEAFVGGYIGGMIICLLYCRCCCCCRRRRRHLACFLALLLP